MKLFFISVSLFLTVCVSGMALPAEANLNDFVEKHAFTEGLKIFSVEERSVQIKELALKNAEQIKKQILDLFPSERPPIIDSSSFTPEMFENSPFTREMITAFLEGLTLSREKKIPPQSEVVQKHPEILPRYKTLIDQLADALGQAFGQGDLEAGNEYCKLLELQLINSEEDKHLQKKIFNVSLYALLDLERSQAESTRSSLQFGFQDRVQSFLKNDPMALAEYQITQNNGYTAVQVLKKTAETSSSEDESLRKRAIDKLIELAVIHQPQPLVAEPQADRTRSYAAFTLAQLHERYPELTPPIDVCIRSFISADGSVDDLARIVQNLPLAQVDDFLWKHILYQLSVLVPQDLFSQKSTYSGSVREETQTSYQSSYVLLGEFAFRVAQEKKNTQELVELSKLYPNHRVFLAAAHLLYQEGGVTPESKRLFVAAAERGNEEAIQFVQNQFKELFADDKAAQVNWMCKLTRPESVLKRRPQHKIYLPESAMSIENLIQSVGDDFGDLTYVGRLLKVLEEFDLLHNWESVTESIEDVQKQIQWVENDSRFSPVLAYYVQKEYLTTAFWAAQSVIKKENQTLIQEKIEQLTKKINEAESLATPDQLRTLAGIAAHLDSLFEASQFDGSKKSKDVQIGYFIPKGWYYQHQEAFSSKFDIYFEVGSVLEKKFNVFSERMLRLAASK